jgi:hypothetical protein
MNYRVHSIAAFVTCVLATAAVAAPAGLEGSWSGSGIAKYQGRTDRLVCRVSFARYGSKSFKVSSSCTSGGAQYQQSGTVSGSGGRYSGHVFNQQYNERGKLAISQRGSRLAVTVTSERGTATLNLSRN